jgi:ribosomal protein L7Ae-like RNA K-turn-binding protein
MEALDVDEVIAQLLVTEGFASVEESPMSSRTRSPHRGLRRDTAAEIQARARDYLERTAWRLRGRACDAKRVELGVADELARAFRASPRPCSSPFGENGIKTSRTDLSDRIEILLMRRCLDQLGLARREGVLISGFEKCHQALKAGRAAWLIEASDGSEDGRTKLLGAVEKSESGVQVCGVFSSSDLGLALGLENAIHHVLPVGRRAERWAFEARRLAGFRPLLPSEWRGRD